ncbi:MAG: hypothetical protein HONBIEJF_00244 [Fimbriimonadaceae bacterium]|nr:hypothetical protein [Fimbriimonadaceae bacterium]
MSLTAVGFAQTPGPKGNKQGFQGKGPGGKGFGGRMRGMSKEFLAKLNLTADQQKKVEALEKSTQSKVQAIMNTDGDRESKMKKMREVMQGHRDAMGKILTKQQQEQMKKMMAEARAKRQKDGKGPDGKGGKPTLNKKPGGGR